ncbi:MAG: hypothetical protein ACOH1Y_15625 [Propionicimonas sp.]
MAASGSNSPDVSFAARAFRASAITGPVAVLATTYWRWIRPWQLTWGATEAEVASSLPGEGMRVLDFTEDTSLLWWDGRGDSTWVWSIQPGEGGTSRLVSRVRMKYRWMSLSILFGLLVEFFDLLMMRRAMLGIAQRAEALVHGSHV